MGTYIDDFISLALLHASMDVQLSISCSVVDGAIEIGSSILNLHSYITHAILATKLSQTKLKSRLALIEKAQDNN